MASWKYLIALMAPQLVRCRIWIIVVRFTYLLQVKEIHNSAFFLSFGTYFIIPQLLGWFAMTCHHQSLNRSPISCCLLSCNQPIRSHLSSLTELTSSFFSESQTRWDEMSWEPLPHHHRGRCLTFNSSQIIWHLKRVIAFSSPPQTQIVPVMVMIM